MLDDLQKFFDRYCKGILNGWEDDTPPVRLSLLGFEADGGAVKTVLERPEGEYPLARETMTSFFLDASNLRLVERAPASEACCSYEAHSTHDTIVSRKATAD